MGIHNSILVQYLAEMDIFIYDLWAGFRFTGSGSKFDPQEKKTTAYERITASFFSIIFVWVIFIYFYFT